MFKLFNKMKILCIGDFHGKFPAKLKKEAKKVDLVVSLGDFPTFTLNKLFLKHCYKNFEVELWDIIGKKKLKESALKDIRNGEYVIKELNKLPKPVVSVLGNYDYFCDDSADDKKSRTQKIWGLVGRDKSHMKKLVQKSKNIYYLDYRVFKFGGFVFIGARGHSFPGYVKSKAYKKYKKILDDLFKKYKNEKIIFVTHNSPHQTKLDKITSKEAPKIAQGKHYGSKMFKRIITKWQPFLNLSGHFHENQGKDKIGKTLLVNPGPAFEGKGAIIDIDDKNKEKIKVRFIK